MNPRRGEHVLNVEGVGAVTLRLSMNALAEIEAALECKTLQELGVRLMDLSAMDVIHILTALIKAGGTNPGIPPVGDWPPMFGQYTKAIGECLRTSGFIGDGVEPEAKNEGSQ